MTKYLRKNNSNTVAFTLSTDVTLTGDSVFFLFRLTNTQTNDEVLFTGTDLSTNIFSYNQFNIIETGLTSVNLTASTINLDPEGWWDYEVYQMTGQTNLSLTGVSGSFIENGRFNVSGDTIPFGQTNVYTGGTTQRFVYKG